MNGALVLLKCSTTGQPTQPPPSAKVHQSKPGKWNLTVVCPVVFIALLHCLTEVTFSFFKRGKIFLLVVINLDLQVFL